MLTKSQRTEAVRLIQEVEALRPRLEQYEKKVPHYKVARFSGRRYYGAGAIISAIIAIYCATTFTCHHTQMSTEFAVLFVVAAVIAAVAAIAMLDCCISPNPEKHKTSIVDLKQMDSLREALNRYRDQLTAHDVAMAEAEKAFPAFESLRPIIEDEFNGTFELIDELERVYWLVILPENHHGRTHFKFSSTHDQYEDLVMEIITAREWKIQGTEAKTRRAAKVREFEKELASNATDNSDSPDSSN